MLYEVITDICYRFYHTAAYRCMASDIKNIHIRKYVTCITVRAVSKILNSQNGYITTPASHYRSFTMSQALHFYMDTHDKNNGTFPEGITPDALAEFYKNYEKACEEEGVRNNFV